MDKVVAQIKYNRKEHKKFYLFHLTHRSNTLTIIGILIVALGGLTIYNVSKNQSVIFSLVMFGAACGVFPFVIISKINQVVKQETPERARSTDTIEITKHKIIRSNDMVSGKAVIGWNNLECVCENDNYFYFYTTNETGLFIKKDSIIEGDIETVRELALANLKKGKKGVNYIRYGNVKREYKKEMRIKKQQEREKRKK